MSTEDIKQKLKEKHREKDQSGALELGELVGEMPMDADMMRQVPAPEELRIDPEKEATLHSIVSRAGYQRNIHRTEGLDYRALYTDLLAFFRAEVDEALGVAKESSDGEGEGAAPDPEGTDQGAAGQPPDPGRPLRDETGGSAQPKRRSRRKRAST